MNNSFVVLWMKDNHHIKIEINISNILVIFNRRIQFVNDILLTDQQRDLSVHDVDYESFDSMFWIKVRRVKRSQFNAVQMMLERCMIRKVIMQSFHSCDNTFSNSHNQSTKKINDMSMSVKDEKISSEIVDLSMRVVTTSDQRICNSSTASIY